MMDAYMRSQARQQGSALTMDDIRRAQAWLKQNGWHGFHDQPPADARASDAIDLVCIDGLWQVPLGLTNARR